MCVCVCVCVCVCQLSGSVSAGESGNEWQRVVVDVREAISKLEAIRDNCQEVVGNSKSLPLSLMPVAYSSLHSRSQTGGPAVKGRRVQSWPAGRSGSVPRRSPSRSTS